MPRVSKVPTFKSRLASFATTDTHFTRDMLALVDGYARKPRGNRLNVSRAITRMTARHGLACGQALADYYADRVLFHQQQKGRKT